MEKNMAKAILLVILFILNEEIVELEIEPTIERKEKIIRIIPG